MGGFDGYAEGEGTVKMMQKLWSGKFWALCHFATFKELSIVISSLRFVNSYWIDDYPCWCCLARTKKSKFCLLPMAQLNKHIYVYIYWYKTQTMVSIQLVVVFLDFVSWQSCRQGTKCSCCVLQNFLFTTKDEHAQLKAIDFGLSDFIKPGTGWGFIPVVLLARSLKGVLADKNIY